MTCLIVSQHLQSGYLALTLSQFSSVAQSCPTFCDPMNSSTPGLLVHHQLQEFTQTHVHWVSDGIQQSHPLLSPSPPTFNLSQHQVFWNESALHIRWPNIGVSASTSVLSMNIQDWFPVGWTDWTPCSRRDSQESSLTPEIKSINPSALSFLYSPTLTSIHDY